MKFPHGLQLMRNQLTYDMYVLKSKVLDLIFLQKNLRPDSDVLIPFLRFSLPSLFIASEEHYPCQPRVRREPLVSINPARLSHHDPSLHKIV